MRKNYFYLLLSALGFIMILQALFVLQFLEWFQAHNVKIIYPLFFSMSTVSLGVMIYFVIRGIMTLKYRKW